MVHDDDAQLNDEQRKAALVLLTEVGRYSVVGTEDQTVSAQDLMKMLAYMAGVVLETDKGLSAPSQFRKAGAYFGELAGHHAKALRIEHERDGFSAMEQVEAMATEQKN